MLLNLLFGGILRLLCFAACWLGACWLGFLGACCRACRACRACLLGSFGALCCCWLQAFRYCLLCLLVSTRLVIVECSHIRRGICIVPSDATSQPSLAC